MATYRYEAVNFSGHTIKGDMEAASRDAVVEDLRRKGYLPIVADSKGTSWLARLSSSALLQDQQLSLREVTHLTQELATMLQAGLSLERALAMLTSLAGRPKLRSFLDDVLAQVRKGVRFSEALAAQQMPLPKAYIAMVRAGEAGGGKMLETTLERLAEYLTRTHKMRESISSALLYPLILLVVAALSILIILLFVLPQFEPLFESAGAALPLSTQIVMAMSCGLRDYGIWGLLLAVPAGFGLHQAFQREEVRLWKDQKLLALPHIGDAVAKSETAKFCRTLGSLLANGIPLPGALAIAIDSIDNRALAGALRRLVPRVREGELFSSLLKREGLFPPLALHMIRIGEETGQLDGMLIKAADIYERDTQRFIERFMVLLTPALTVLLGAVIAAIIASVLSAILGVNDLIP